MRLASKNADKANVLNSFFTAQTRLVNCPSSVPALPRQVPADSFFKNLSTTPTDVFDILTHLKPGKAPGLDDIPPRLLTECACGVSASLSKLFSRSFVECRLPKEWKDALVVPIFKGGEKFSSTNYRPITLLSLVSKSLEKIVFHKLNTYLQPFLTMSQSGFRRKDSTQKQLVRLVQEWANALDSAEYVGVVFFDMKKAFDRVWHEGLLHKLAAFGVEGRALEWFRSFLTGRRQCVAVGSAVSDIAPLEAGVPQGAILSPLLFLVYMNDIVTATSTSTNLFADDTSTFVCDKSPAALQSRLQTTVCQLEEWFGKWALTVNTLKSAMLVLTTRRRAILQFDIRIYDTPISQVLSHKHLGVVLNSHLCWSDHVRYVVGKASKKIGLLRRFRKRLDPLVMRTIYRTCIQPTLEYSSLALSGLSKTDSARLEQTQRVAARLITSTSLRDRLPSDILLARAGLEPLSLRQQQGLALLAYRLTRSVPQEPTHLVSAFPLWPSQSTPSTSSMPLRSSSFRLPRPRTEVMKCSPFYQAFSIWNSLSAECQSSCARVKAAFLFP